MLIPTFKGKNNQQKKKYAALLYRNNTTNLLTSINKNISYTISALDYTDLFNPDLGKQLIHEIKFDGTFTSRSREPEQCCIPALVDTGAGISCMTSRVADRLRLIGAILKSEDPSHGPTIKSAGGVQMTPLAIISVRGSINNKPFLAPFFVFPELTSPIIMGMNMIRGLNLKIEFSDRTETINSQQAPRPAAAHLKLSKGFSIPSRTAQLVSAQLVDAQNEPIRQSRDLIITHNFITCAIKSDDRGWVTFYAKNPSQSLLSLQGRKGELFATAEDLIDTVKPGDGCSESGMMTTQKLIQMDAIKRTPWANRRGRRGARPSQPRDAAIYLPQNQERRRQLEDEIRTMIKRRVEGPLRKSVTKMFRDNLHLFSATPTDIGLDPTTEHKINLSSQVPAFKKQFPIPDTHHETIVKGIKEWLQLGIIEPASSPFNAPIFCVPKKEGQGLRVVLDYRHLNAQTLPDRYSIRTVEDCIAQVGKARSKIFSTLDLTSGFWQMALDKAARHLTAFTVPGMGQFQWNRGAMGLTGCPASFARMMDKIMADLQNVLTYIDDVLVHSRTQKEHCEHLAEVFRRLSVHNLKLNFAKCDFFSSNTQYLGYTLTETGILPGKDKTQAIREARIPTSKTEIKSFLGVANYFRYFIPAMSKIAQPLNTLAAPITKWTGGRLPEDALRAFRLIQDKITRAPVLAYPNSTGTFHLMVDAASGGVASEGGLGACLQQEDEYQQLRPVGYASRVLASNEKNYSAFLLEIAAANFGMEYFSQQLRGRPFILHTDHKPMLGLSVSHKKTLNRLQENMLEFAFEIRYIPGKDNAIADYLSRSLKTDVSATTAMPLSLEDMRFNRTDVHREQVKDRTCQLIMKAISEGKQPKFRGHNNILFSRDELFREEPLLIVQTRMGRKGLIEKPRVVLPESFAKEIIQGAHNHLLMGGHGGQAKTFDRINEKWWWPSAARDVKDHIQRCGPCNQSTPKTHVSNPPLQPNPIPQKPNERVHVDLFGPVKSHTGKKYVVVMTDALTKMVRLSVVKSKTAEEVAQSIVDNWIYIYGVPKMIVSDQGNEFVGQMSTALFRALQIEHKTTTPFHPQTNAAAERFNQTMITYLNTAINEGAQTTLDWELYLGPLQFSFNTAVHRATRMTPFYALFGYDPRQPLWPDMEELIPDKKIKAASSGEAVARLKEIQATARRIVTNNLQEAQETYKMNHDRRNNVHPTTFFQGQKIWWRRHKAERPNPKFEQHWFPGFVVEQKSSTVIVINKLRGRKKTQTMNISKVRPRIDDADIPTDESSGHGLDMKEDDIEINDDSDTEEEDDESTGYANDKEQINDDAEETEEESGDSEEEFIRQSPTELRFNRQNPPFRPGPIPRHTQTGRRPHTRSRGKVLSALQSNEEAKDEIMNMPRKELQNLILRILCNQVKGMSHTFYAVGPAIQRIPEQQQDVGHDMADDQNEDTFDGDDFVTPNETCEPQPFNRRFSLRAGSASAKRKAERVIRSGRELLSQFSPREGSSGTPRMSHSTPEQRELPRRSPRFSPITKALSRLTDFNKAGRKEDKSPLPPTRKRHKSSVSMVSHEDRPSGMIINIIQ